MKIIIILILALIVGSSLYQYDQTYGFDAIFNPAILLLWGMVLIRIAGIIGQYFTQRDMKKGYCNLGVTEEQIRCYREIHNFS